MGSPVKVVLIFVISWCLSMRSSDCHGPPIERDDRSDDMMTGSRKAGTKWCSMAKVCNHDRMPICGANNAGDMMGFRDLCDMFDYNCLRKRNYKQVGCPEDKSMLSVSRRPTGYYEE